MSEDQHPKSIDLLVEKLQSEGYNILGEDVDRLLLKDVVDCGVEFGAPYDEGREAISEAKVSTSMLLLALTNIHYELSLERRPYLAGDAAELFKEALRLAQRLHQFSKQL